MWLKTANFHTCYLPFWFEFFHKSHWKHKLNYSWPHVNSHMYDCHSIKLSSILTWNHLCDMLETDLMSMSKFALKKH